MTRIRRHLDRRALFASGAAAALLAASGLSAEDRPQRGGRLRIAAADAAGVLSVARLAVFDTLTEVAPDGILRGELATGWRGSPDARHWQIDLRDDAVFHDGRPFVAADAIGALTAPASPVAATIAEARAATGGIEITLRAGDADFPYRLSTPALAIAPGGIVPADMADWTGTGLYRLAEARQGRHFLGRRMDAHYKDGQAGWFDSVEAIAISDAEVRAEALRDGFVEVAEDPAGADNILPSSGSIARPATISTRGRFDDGRVAERWWMA